MLASTDYASLNSHRRTVSQTDSESSAGPHNLHRETSGNTTIPSGEAAVRRIPSGEAAVRRIPSGEAAVRRIPSGEAAVRRITLAPGVTTHAGVDRAGDVAAS
jgi:hypothetical protein